jgi:large subunit ribosomal protein L17
MERMSAHRKATIRSMVTALFRYGRIKTTRMKAMEVRRFAERLITRAKVDNVHNRRLASARLYDEGIVAKLFTEIGPDMKDRQGGYTRVLKLGQRYGDGAEMVFLELVNYKPKEKKELTDEEKKKKASMKAAKAATRKDN